MTNLRNLRGWTLEILEDVPQIPIIGLRISFDPSPINGPTFGEIEATFYTHTLDGNHPMWAHMNDQMAQATPTYHPPAVTIRIRPNRNTESWNDILGCRMMSCNWSDLDHSGTDMLRMEVAWKFRDQRSNLNDPFERYRQRHPLPRLSGREPQLQKLDWRTSGF